MANPIQRLLKQARDAVPDQRPVRLPWQEPTLGERVAGGLDTLADTADEWGTRATDARLAAGERAADLADRARGRVSDIQERVSDQLGEAQEHVSGQAAAAQQRTRGRLRKARERTRGQAAQLAESAQHAQSRAQSQVKDRFGRAKKRLQDAAPGGRQAPEPEDERDQMPAMPEWGGASLARLSAPPVFPASQGGYVDASMAADRATFAAARAERASSQALAAANQIATLLTRLLTAQTHETVRTVRTEEAPSDIEIRVDEAAGSPLERAADAVARALAAAGETVYDYSEGHYGLPPRDAKELRRARMKEQGRPVTIIEGHYADEKPARSRMPLLIAGLAMAAGLAGLAGYWYMRQRSQEDQAHVHPARPRRAPFTAQPPTPTPAFDRVVGGELLPNATGVPASDTPTTASPSARRTAPARGTVTSVPSTDTPTPTGGAEGNTRTFTAGEPSSTQTEPRSDTSSGTPRQ